MIFVVDDDPEIRQLMLKYLNLLGLRVYVFDNALAALSAITAVEAKVVITDFEMPEMDGLSLANRLKKLKNRPLIILMSANLEKVPPGANLLADDFLRKPFDLSELKEKVEKMLSLAT